MAVDPQDLSEAELFELAMSRPQRDITFGDELIWVRSTSQRV